MAHDKVYGHCENLCEVEVIALERLVNDIRNYVADPDDKVPSVTAVLQAILRQFGYAVEKSGDTMTGDLDLKSHLLKFFQGGITWKEDGYGDKFKIAADFSGADDANILKIMGAVGGAGEDPSLYDLMTLSAKSGNMKLKGNLKVKNNVDIVTHELDNRTTLNFAKKVVLHLLEKVML